MATTAAFSRSSSRSLSREIGRAGRFDLPGPITRGDRLGRTGAMITCPGNWNARPVAADSRTIAREFLEAVAGLPAGAAKPIGLRVPSVVSSDFNVLVDPSRKSECTAAISGRTPFNTLRATRS